MRRFSLPVAFVVVVTLTVVVPPTAGAGPDGADRPPRAESTVASASAEASHPVLDAVTTAANSVVAPYDQVALELDPTVVVPALTEAFGERYGGYWIEVRETDDVMHIGVVGATPADAEVVAQVTGGHPRVVTDPVEHGLADLMAAQDEIAATIDPEDGNFAVETDPATNSVVVRTESSDAADTLAVAQDAARRGAAEQAATPAEQPREGPVPAPPAAIPDAAAAPAEVAPTDVATAVTVEPATDIVIEPQDRRNFPPYEAGQYALIAWPGRKVACTTGYLFHNSAYGYFGSTAGHCGRQGYVVGIGSRIADLVRANSYFPNKWVMADAALVSMSTKPWPAWPMVNTGSSQRGITGRYLNTQLGAGLRLCFQGISSNSGNCGALVRVNEWLCCDAAGHGYFYSCLNYPSLGGDSGGPVYFPRGASQAVAAGMVSSSVTINGQRLTCFTMVESIEFTMHSRMVSW
jgi:hypothetical protein